jgi:predicted DCC family thiol-disulfide oxidoreductase YuxK
MPKERRRMAAQDSRSRSIRRVSVPAESPLVLFDGVCNLCHGSVQFIIRRDPQARFRFAALQSAAGQQALAAAGVLGKLPDSIVLVRGGRVQVKSAAALAIARGLRWPWPLLSVFWVVPYPLRDLVYDFIARNRIRWFGQRQECWVPTKELRARFLDAGERR